MQAEPITAHIVSNHRNYPYHIIYYIKMQYIRDTYSHAIIMHNKGRHNLRIRERYDEEIQDSIHSANH